MNEQLFTSTIVLLLVVSAVTLLVILNKVKKIDQKLVSTMAYGDKRWGADLNLNKFFRSYKIYYQSVGINVILILNIGSYISAIILLILMFTNDF